MPKDTPWFAAWFDTTYYHTLYQHRDDKEAARFMENLVSYLSLDTSCQVLDLACGKGRHAKFLHELGLNVTGLDLSENSIQIARQFENDHLRFDVHDMREVYPHATFDAIFNLFTSFGYFEDQSDNLKMLQSCYHMLNDAGILVIDFMNASKVIENLVTEEVKSLDGIDFRISRSYDGTFIIKDIEFEDQGVAHRYQERVQALRLDDFRRLLNLAGFESQQFFGDYGLCPFNETTSDRLVILARKQ
jgi:SAM-dependent methyltransferase